MIQVNVTRDHGGNVLKYQVTGHAQAAEPGEDVVCAAVSVLSQTTILGLYKVAHIKVSYEIKAGYLVCEMPQELTPEERIKANMLLETMVLGIKNLMVSYSEYITLHDKEV